MPEQDIQGWSQVNSSVGEYFWQLWVSPDSPFSSPTPPGQRIKMMYPQQSKSEQRTMKIIYLPLAWSSFSLSLRLRHWQGTLSLVMGTSFSWEKSFCSPSFPSAGICLSNTRAKNRRGMREEEPRLWWWFVSQCWIRSLPFKIWSHGDRHEIFALVIVEFEWGDVPLASYGYAKFSWYAYLWPQSLCLLLEWSF